ncbi:MAG: hypothetical protein J6Y16_07330 [Treponema sp.]|nr:hypothetical protein [Treponema sp.]
MEHYCIMVKTGSEDSFRADFEKILREYDSTAELMFFKKKMRTSKKIEYEQALFPGYVFISIQELNPDIIRKARANRNFYHFLPSNTEIHPLEGKDLEYLSNLKKFGEVQGFSKAYFNENMRIVVTDGPLMGFAGNIIKVNRKRQRVTVRLDLCSSTVKFDLAYDEISAENKSNAS